MKNKMFLLLATMLTVCMSMFLLTACVESSNIEVSYISLNRSYVTLQVGDTERLYANILPSNATDKTLTWSSSNTFIATVSQNGLVTAKAEGNAVITVKASNNETTNCYVTIHEKTTEITSITLNKTSATLEEGSTLSLNATIIPSNATNKTLTWSSSNTSVATVSPNGLVTAKAEGSAIITVRTNNNKYATCNITVNSQFVFEEYSTGYALIKYNGNSSVVTVPSSYNGKEVVVIGSGKAINYQYVLDGFAENKNIKKVILPDSVWGINHAAFANCSLLEEIVMPNVKKIGRYAFYNCTSINKIDFSESLEHIYSYAFAGCNSLQCVDFPASLNKLEDKAFYECSSLSSVKFQNKTATIGSNVFYGCNLKWDISLPSTPLTFNNWSVYNYVVGQFIHTTAIISDIDIKITNANTNSISIKIYISGQKTYDFYGTSHMVKFNYKIKKNNTVLESGTISSVSVAEGESFIAESYSINLDLSMYDVFSLNNNFLLELNEVAW